MEILREPTYEPTTFCICNICGVYFVITHSEIKKIAIKVIEKEWFQKPKEHYEFKCPKCPTIFHVYGIKQ